MGRGPPGFGEPSKYSVFTHATARSVFTGGIEQRFTPSPLRGQHALSATANRRRSRAPRGNRGIEHRACLRATVHRRRYAANIGVGATADRRRRRAPRGHRGNENTALCASTSMQHRARRHPTAGRRRRRAPRGLRGIEHRASRLPSSAATRPRLSSAPPRSAGGAALRAGIVKINTALRATAANIELGATAGRRRRRAPRGNREINTALRATAANI